MGNFIYELSEGREILSIDDFFEFLIRNPHKNTIAWLYYVYPLSMNKTLGSREVRSKELNPFYGKILKHKPYKFQWDRTYAEAQKAINPDYEFKGGTSTYEKVEGFKVLQKGNNGLYLPIVPMPSGTKPTYTTLDYKPIDESEFAQYMLPERPYDPTRAPMMQSLVRRIAGVSAGGATWNNPEAEFKYMGSNGERFQ